MTDATRDSGLGRSLRGDAAAHVSDPAGMEGPAAGTPWRWLLAITFVAAVVRLIGANGGLWADEIYSLVDSIRPPLATILTHYPSDTQHPLYMPLAHGSIALFGEHPWSVRLPALVFGVASVPILYALGAVVTSRREALLAAALLAVSYHHVWFSQNARGYSMLAFWTILSTFLLVRAVRENRRMFYLGYAAVAGLGVYTHLTMVFMVAGQALACAWLLARRDPRDVRDWRLPLLGFALAAVLTLALYAPILPQVLHFFLHTKSQTLGVSTPSWAFGEAIRVLRLGFGGLGVVGLVALAGGALVFAAGVVSYLAQSRFIGLLFVLPGAVAVLGALAARGTMYPRFFFFLAGIAVLTVVRGAMGVARWISAPLSHGRMSGEALGTTLVGAMILLSAASLPYDWRYPKQDFAGAMRFVDAERSPRDAVAGLGQAAFPYRQLYRRQWDSVATAGALDSLRARGERVWLLYTLPRYLESRAPELMAVVRRDCPVVRTFPGTLSGGDVVVASCRPDKTRASRASP